MNWTLFVDRHSGNGQKEKFDTICIELPINEAIEWFEKIFKRCPFNITCNCCGEDYSVESVTAPKGDEDLILKKEEIINFKYDSVNSYKPYFAVAGFERGLLPNLNL